MKKYLLIVAFLVLPFASAKEEVPLLINNTSAIGDSTEEYNPNLINSDNMKKGDKIKSAQEELSKTPSRKIKLDSRQINHQRALDYTTRQNNSTMLPTF